MVALFKALPFGIILTFIVALLIGSGGSTGGFLEVRTMTVFDVQVLWSWRLFLGATGLAWGLLLMMGD